MLSRFTTIVAEDGINISDLVNRSRGDYAYTMLDLDSPTNEEFVKDLKQVDGVIRVRVIK
jgi:D-3-phosphoglycerate dehydrogenase